MTNERNDQAEPITPIGRKEPLTDIQDQQRTGLTARFCQDMVEMFARLVRQASVQHDDHALLLFVGATLGAWLSGSYARRIQDKRVRSEDDKRLLRAMDTAPTAIESNLASLIARNVDVPSATDRPSLWPFFSDSFLEDKS